MREWLSGGAPPCQGGGRGFDPRLALFFILLKNVVKSRERRVSQSHENLICKVYEVVDCIQ